MWEVVQLEMERRKELAYKYGISKLDYATVNNPFAGRIICGQCGSPFGRKVRNSTDERLRRVVWRCNKKYEVKGKKSCENKHVDDRVLYLAFINTFNAMVENKDYFMAKWQEQIDGEDILKRVTAKRFISIFQNAQPIQELDMDLYFKLLEKITVHDGDRLIVSLLDGTEIECEIE